MHPSSEPTLLLSHYEVGWTERYGPKSVSKDEIIAYAKVVDPQPLHLDEAYAKTTRFKGLIASGLHSYTLFHNTYWVPLVRETFICGLSIEGVAFSAPLYPDQPIWGVLSITDTDPKPEKGTTVVGWRWVFENEQGAEIQRVGYHSYHKLLP